MGVTGGIAAYKSLDVLRMLQCQGHGVSVVMTHTAERFVGSASFAALSQRTRMILKSRQIGATYYFAFEALIDAIAAGGVLPVLCGSAAKNIGFPQLLDAIVALLPAPASRAPEMAIRKMGFRYGRTAPFSSGRRSCLRSSIICLVISSRA